MKRAIYLHNPHNPIKLLLFCLLLTVCLSACRQSQQQSQGNDAITIQLQTNPETPAPGEAEFLITLLDQAGNRIEGAKIDVRGDMTHAGMEPVLASAETSTADDYRVPFQWTMAGDWVVTITATLPNGQTAQKTFDFTVNP